MFILFTAGGVSAETSIWRVQQNESVAYLCGTIHMLRNSDYPLPDEFSRAFADTEMIVLETNVDALKSADTQAMILEKGMYQDATRLDRVLSPKTYGRLKRFCDDSGTPIDLLNKFKPSMVALTLTGIELQKLGATETGVDIYFQRLAKEHGKKIGDLESVEEQIHYLLSMGEGNEDAFIENTLNDLVQIKIQLNELIDAWRQGDEERLDQLFVAPMKKDYPKIYQALMVERNQKWLPKIEAYLDTPPQEMILVGAGHLIGIDGILAQLKRRGYKVGKLK